MKTIIAIGGGSFQKQETIAIDQYAIKRTCKTHPQVLFLPSATRDDQGYSKRFKQYYRSLGCEVEAIRLFHTKLSIEEVHEKILQCDLLYIGAGNLNVLMECLHAWKLGKMILQAYEKGIVCVGISAGASAFFTWGYSDLYDDGESFDYVPGMNILPGQFCPHIQDERRQAFFTTRLQQEEKIGVKDRDAYIMEDDKKIVFSTKF